MKYLHIPYGCNKQRELVSAENATKENEYFCPSCSASLILRKGEIRVAHFAHFKDDVCDFDTILHKTAELLIMKAIGEWKRDVTPPPTIKSKCRMCDCPIDIELPEKVKTSEREFTLGKYRGDVVLLGDNLTPLLDVEIRISHAVDPDKQQHLPIKFVELEGTEIIKDYRNWYPIYSTIIRPICGKCTEKEKEIALLASSRGIKFDKNFYHPELTSCWNCNKQILVFTWKDHKLFPSVKPPIEPMPFVLKLRYSKTIGREYWANVCFHCGKIQGDYFLYHELGAPFGKLFWPDS